MINKAKQKEDRSTGDFRFSNYTGASLRFCVSTDQMDSNLSRVQPATDLAESTSSYGLFQGLRASYQRLARGSIS